MISLKIKYFLHLTTSCVIRFDKAHRYHEFSRTLQESELSKRLEERFLYDPLYMDSDAMVVEYFVPNPLIDNFKDVVDLKTDYLDVDSHLSINQK